MGGRAEVLAPELSRTAHTRWLTLPVTLPFIPEAVRTRALQLMKRAKGRPEPTSAGKQIRFCFGEDDLVIGPDVQRGVNLVALAYKMRRREKRCPARPDQ